MAEKKRREASVRHFPAKPREVPITPHKAKHNKTPKRKRRDSDHDEAKHTTDATARQRRNPRVQERIAQSVYNHTSLIKIKGRRF
jgi:hypothetical protein